MNGEAKSINKQILNKLKKILDVAKRLWAYELPAILLSIRTIKKSATRETLFILG